MFTDGTSLSYSASTTSGLQNVINSELKKLNSWLITNRLSLNTVKMEFMVIGSQQKLRSIDSEINMKINENEITRVDSVKSLGVYIDKHLAWHDHIDKLCKKVASAIDALKRVRSFITIDASTQIYQSLIQPHFDYCCMVWDGLGETLSTKLQKLQNRAARVVMRSSYDTQIKVFKKSLRREM